MTVVRRSQPSLAAREFRRILLVKPSSLGDLVHALPVLHGLRKRYPDASISWLVAKPFAPLIASHPELDHVVEFDRARYGRFGRSVKATLEFMGFLRSLRASRFDLALDLQGLFRSGLLTMATGAPVRIGFDDVREMASVFYTHRVRAALAGTHAVERNFLVSRTLGFADVPVEFDLAVMDEERRAADVILLRAGIDTKDPFLAVFPGGRWDTKRWHPPRIAATLDEVSERYSVRSVLLGGPSERPLGDQIARSAHNAPANLIGASTLREMVAITERASVVLAHDSAPMHIAAALKRPLVAILGPTNRHRTGPYPPGEADVLQASLPCVPCYLKRLAQCRYNHQCMDEVQVSNVVRAIGQRLAQKTGWAIPGSDGEETGAAG